MAETAADASKQDRLTARYLEKASGINDLQWDDILVRVLRYGTDPQTSAILGAIAACAKHKSGNEPGFDAEMHKVLRLAGPQTWLAVLQALASREQEQDRVAYFTIAPLYYLTVAIVMEGDNLWQQQCSEVGTDPGATKPSWFHRLS